MRYLWLLLGLTTFFLGVIGILLPILPTTPFFIITTYSLSKSSKKVNSWFQSLKLTKKYLKPIVFTPKKKWTLLLIVDSLLIAYIVLFENVYLRIILILIILIKHYVFYKYVPTTKLSNNKS